MNTLWDAEKVREELPDVRVKLSSGKIVVGQVKGRELEFAHVIVYLEDGYVNRNVEVAWSTIADCLNRGSAIII